MLQKYFDDNEDRRRCEEQKKGPNGCFIKAPPIDPNMPAGFDIHVYTEVK